MTLGEVCEHGSLKRQCLPCEQRDEIDHLHSLLEPHENLLAKYHEQLQAADALAKAVKITRLEAQAYPVGLLANGHSILADYNTRAVDEALANYEKVRGMK